MFEEGNKFTGAWNFGPILEDSITVIELARRFKKIWNELNYDITDSGVKEHEANLLRLDCDSMSNFRVSNPGLSNSSFRAK